MDVVQRLLAQATRTPDAIAVAAQSGSIVYADFVARAAAYAVRFSGHQRVLVALTQGADAYAAMFGAMMAGCVYAPVNVASPLPRLTHIRDLFEPDVIVAEPNLGDRLAEAACAQVDPAGIETDRRRRPPVEAPASDALAYVIFTSGSTGAPKGVAISRRGLAHYIDWLGPALAIGPGDRMSQHPNIGFDLSVLDIFGALCHGAALHPFAETSARLLPARKVRDEAITIWNSVPSVVSAMETAGELDAAHLASVRLFTFCGEILHRHQVAALFAARPDAVVFNTYGPTEATVAITCRRLTADNFEALCSPSAPLGAPIGDMRLELVGGVDAGEGEIVISGPQIAAGYWRDPDLTAARFRTAPWGGAHAFLTGDHARRIGGELYFLGRGDDMVKVRGHRVHLGEIRRALEDLGWTQVFVFADQGAIHAIVEAAGGRVFDEDRLRQTIAQRLDGYFVPARIKCVARFPRTGNDKIDAATLKTL